MNYYLETQQQIASDITEVQAKLDKLKQDELDQRIPVPLIENELRISTAPTIVLPANYVHALKHMAFGGI